jgi:hypothetical protein
MADNKEKLLSGEEIEALPIEERVVYRYNHAQGSIQDIARVYRLSMEEVLKLIGHDNMLEIPTQGDLIDQSEAGPEVRVNPMGNPARNNFTTD